MRFMVASFKKHAWMSTAIAITQGYKAIAAGRRMDKLRKRTMRFMTASFRLSSLEP
jgi:hypothetical protein